MGQKVLINMKKLLLSLSYLLFLVACSDAQISSFKATTMSTQLNAFDPNILPGQIIIWDVTNASSVTQSGGLLSGLTNTGSGSSNDISIAANKPSYFATGGSNNQAYAKMNTAGAGFGVAPIGGSTGTMIIYMMVRMPTMGLGDDTNRVFYNFTGSQGLYFTATATSKFLRLYLFPAGGPYSYPSYATVRPGTWMMLKVTQDVSEASIKVNDEYTEPYNVSGATQSFTRLQLDSWPNIEISEVRVFNQFLSVANDQNLKNYFLGKYNIQKPTYSMFFFGDSHTAGVQSGSNPGDGLGSYVNRVSNAGVIAFNWGSISTVVDPGTTGRAPGSNLSDLYQLFYSSKYNNTIITFQYGTNDALIFGGTGALTRAQTKASYKAIIQTFIDRGWPLSKLIICTPPFSTGSYVRPGGNTTVFPNFVTDAIAIGAELGIPVADFYGALQTAGYDCSTVTGGDGINMDNAGHLICYNTLKAVAGF